jgi:hypothetical protein
VTYLVVWKLDRQFRSLRDVLTLNGAARGGRGWIPQSDRSHRHDHTGAANDGVCGVRAWDL